MRKLIEGDQDTLQELTVLGRDRMATIQGLTDEAFSDPVDKARSPLDLKDALKKTSHKKPNK
ncbi:MAG: hypothetical protein J0G33_10435 [Afipia felis]|nr:hypothetical protein [Afipia felis]